MEETSFPHSVSLIGLMEEIDEILAKIDYALYRNPSGFPLLPGTKAIHVAKTKLRIFGMRVVPAYRMFVRVDYAQKCVFKLWIELSPPSDMSFGASLNDEEDDIPF
jgi:hypothetical protein